MVDVLLMLVLYLLVLSFVGVVLPPAPIEVLRGQNDGAAVEDVHEVGGVDAEQPNDLVEDHPPLIVGEPL
jgi:hypothetical protein